MEHLFIFFIFLLITLFSVYLINPKTKQAILASAILIPTGSLIVFAIITAFFISIPSNIVADVMGIALFSALFSGVFTFYILKNKVENNNKVKLPTSFTVIIAIMVAISVLQYSSTNKKDAINETHELMTVSYNGISFKYPNNWDIQKNNLEEGLMYQIYCQERGDNTVNFFSIILMGYEMSPDYWISGTIDEMKNNKVYYNVEFSAITPSEFNNISSKTVDYVGESLGEKFQGHITSFNINEKTVLMLKHSDSKTKLDNDFRVMEESLKIE